MTSSYFSSHPTLFYLIFYSGFVFLLFFQQDVIQAIKETAFVTSEYPVILSFENHCRCVCTAFERGCYCRKHFVTA